MSCKIRDLLIRSAQIQTRIAEEHRRAAPNWLTLLRLKVLRLRLKDRLRALASAPLCQTWRSQEFRPAGTAA